MEENISEALKIAGSVLLFVIALSITIPAITNTRIAVDTIVARTDRETLSVENDSRYYYLANSNATNRAVGLDTIIPSIYRAYIENYRIVFEFDDEYYLYARKSEPDIGITAIDLNTKEVGIGKGKVNEFINGILYRKYPNNNKATFDKNHEIIMPEDGTGKAKVSLYQKINNWLSDSNHSIIEYLGTYYTEDVVDYVQKPGATYEDELNINKTEKRVITYKFETK